MTSQKLAHKNVGDSFIIINFHTFALTKKCNGQNHFLVRKNYLQVNIIGLAQAQLRYLFSPSLPASSRNHLPPSESRHGVFATTSLLAVPVPNDALERKAAEGDE